MSVDLNRLMSAVPSTPQSRQKDMEKILESIVQDIQQISAESAFIKPFSWQQLRFYKGSREDCPETFLHMLPGELRNRIYRLVGLPSRRQHLDDFTKPVLAEAISSLCPEILAMHFAEATFEVDTYSELMVRSTLISPQRARFRGVRYGTGTLKLEENNWIRKADQLAVRFHHVHIQVREKDGHKICLIVLNNTRGSTSNGPRMSVQRVTSQHLKGRLKQAKKDALKYVGSLRKEKDHPGFSLEHLEKIVGFFKDPDTIPKKVKGKGRGSLRG